MKRSKIVSLILAATCALSAFSGLSVSAALIQQDLPYCNTFDTDGDLLDTDGWKKVIPSGASGISIRDNKLQPMDNTAAYWRWVELDFETISSGKVVFEYDATYGATVNGGFWRADDYGLFEMINEQGQSLAGIWAEAQAAVYMNGYLGTSGYASKIMANTFIWLQGTRHYKVVVDLDNDKWHVYQSFENGDNLVQWKTQGNENDREGNPILSTTDFSFRPDTTNHNISKIAFGMRNPCSIDNLKIYQLPSQSATEYNLYVGDTQRAEYTISATGNTPAIDLWETSDANIATVENGVITAKGKGSATITAKSNTYGTILTYTVNVAIPVTEILLDKESATIAVGGTPLTLNATILPVGSETPLVWASSDDTVATVTDGVVTAVAGGNATISVTGQDRNGSPIIASCDVTVYLPATDITFSANSEVLNVGETADINFALVPADATETAAIWRSSNHYVATVNSAGVVTAVNPGVANIYLNCAGLTKSVTVTVIGTEDNIKSPLLSFAEIQNSFTDIGDVRWAQTAIMNAVANGFMTPDSANVFGAQRNIKRDEFVSVIVKTLGLETAEAEEPAEKTFDDVTEENPYYAEIMKAVELGIIDGVSETSFAPNADITRQDIAVVINKALVAADIETAEGRLDFTDKDSIAEYAQTSVRVLSKMNIMVGKDGGRFDPLANATRAETAVISDKITALR